MGNWNRLIRAAAVETETLRKTLRARLQDVLERLDAATRDVESALAVMKAEHDPLASHIFVSRRHYRNVNDGSSCEAVNDCSRPNECNEGGPIYRPPQVLY